MQSNLNNALHQLHRVLIDARWHSGGGTGVAPERVVNLLDAAEDIAVGLNEFLVRVEPDVPGFKHVLESLGNKQSYFQGLAVEFNRSEKEADVGILHRFSKQQLTAALSAVQQFIAVTGSLVTEGADPKRIYKILDDVEYLVAILFTEVERFDLDYFRNYLQHIETTHDGFSGIVSRFDKGLD